MKVSAEQTTSKTLVGGFLDYLISSRNLALSTKRFYAADLRHFATFLQGKAGSEFEVAELEENMLKASADLLGEFPQWLYTKGYMPRTIRRMTACLRSFYRWLHKTGQIQSNPASSLYGPHVDLIRNFTDLGREDVKKLCEVPSNTTPTGCRDRALLSIVAHTGLSVRELLSLRRNDVSLACDCLIVRRGGGKIQVILLESQDVSDALSRYIKLRDGLHGQSPVVAESTDQGQPFLFLNCRGKRLSPRSVGRNLKKYLESVGFDSKITPQSLRADFIVRKIREGVDFSEIAIKVGNRSRFSILAYRTIASRS